jgi:hypothetical protein
LLLGLGEEGGHGRYCQGRRGGGHCGGVTSGIRPGAGVVAHQSAAHIRGAHGRVGLCFCRVPKLHRPHHFNLESIPLLLPPPPPPHPLLFLLRVLRLIISLLVGTTFIVIAVLSTVVVVVVIVTVVFAFFSGKNP